MEILCDCYKLWDKKTKKRKYENIKKKYENMNTIWTLYLKMNTILHEKYTSYLFESDRNLAS